MSADQDDKNIFIKTLEWVCKKLDYANIPYMITGGSAVGFWGHIRSTMDIDIVIQIEADTIDRFLQSLEEDAYINIETTRKLISNKKMFNVIHNSTCFKVDFIPLQEDIYEVKKFNNRTKIAIQDIEIYVISPEDLIISKLLWSKKTGESERQIKDCESIYRLNSESLNIDYMKKWVKELHIEDKFEKLQTP